VFRSPSARPSSRSPLRRDRNPPTCRPEKGNPSAREGPALLRSFRATVLHRDRPRPFPGRLGLPGQGPGRLTFFLPVHPRLSRWCMPPLYIARADCNGRSPPPLQIPGESTPSVTFVGFGHRKSCAPLFGPDGAVGFGLPPAAPRSCSRRPPRRRPRRALPGRPPRLPQIPRGVGAQPLRAEHVEDLQEGVRVQNLPAPGLVGPAHVQVGVLLAAGPAHGAMAAATRERRRGRLRPPIRAENA